MKEWTISTNLNRLRKVDLEDLGNLLGRDFPSGLRKQVLVRDLAGYLTEQPKEWLSHLLGRDLLLLEWLVDAGPENPRYVERWAHSSLLEISGIVDYEDTDGLYRKVWVRREVYDIVAPYVAGVKWSEDVSGRFKVEQAAFGYLNLYGIIPTRQFNALLTEYYASVFGTGYENLYRMMGKSPLYKLCSYWDGQDDYLCSPYLSQPDDVLQLRREAGVAEDDLRSFNPDEVFAAGNDGLQFSLGYNSPEGETLTSLLKRIGYEGHELVKAQHDIWMESQFPFVGGALFDVLTERGTISSDSLYAACVRAVVDYANAVPKWALNGYSSVEKDYLLLEYPETEEPAPYEPEEGVPQWSMPHPTISDGYTDLIEKDEALDRLSSLMPEGFPFGLAIPHVAPDDPCPCGSGLRYARCHGKNPS